MVSNVGWRDAKFSSKGQFYSRWKDRINKRGIVYVAKHSGEVYSDVKWNGKKWVGVGFLGIEPVHANFSGDDNKITSKPNITKRQIDDARRTGKSISYSGIRLRKPVVVRFRKPLQPFRA